jgi:hypothetical protein
MCSVGCIVTADSCGVWFFHLLDNGIKFSTPYSGKFVLYNEYVKASGTTACPCITGSVMFFTLCPHYEILEHSICFSIHPMLYVEMHSYRKFLYPLSYVIILFCALLDVILIF